MEVAARTKAETTGTLMGIDFKTGSVLKMQNI